MLKKRKDGPMSSFNAPHLNISLSIINLVIISLIVVAVGL